MKQYLSVFFCHSSKAANLLVVVFFPHRQGVLRGDPATVQELRTKVLDDLEEVREEIAELIEVEVGERVKSVRRYSGGCHCCRRR